MLIKKSMLLYSLFVFCCFLLFLFYLFFQKQEEKITVRYTKQSLYKGLQHKTKKNKTERPEEKALMLCSDEDERVSRQDGLKDEWG